MAVRLHTRLGVVAEQDRLASAPDTVLVNEPTTGATARSKGNLYLVVVAADGGPRSREATALVAETIQHHYYYDESAGIPVCLEKAIRTADQRVRHQRERLGVAPGSIGAAAAVLRDRELYVTTVGEAAAYLLRQARLLTLPEDGRRLAMPSPGDALPDVWRGELAVGDTLVLTSRHVTETVGTDELKNAVVTLHPQSAAEHLHHLYVAAGGEGPDALLVIEATEVPATAAGQTLVPVKAAEPLAGAPERSPIPLAEPLSDAAVAIGVAGRQIRERASRALNRLLGRMQDQLPRREPLYHSVTPLPARREAQQRFAIAALAILGLVAVLALAAWWLGGQTGGPGGQIPQVGAGEEALRTARDRLDQVFGGGQNLVLSDPAKAKRLLREAYSQLDKAKAAGVSDGKIAPLRAKATAGLDTLYGVLRNAATAVFAFGPDVPAPDIGDLVPGPLGEAAAYLIERSTKAVYRVDLAAGTVVAVVAAGAKVGDRAVDAPWHLATGGPDLLILDKRGALWRWRPAGGQGQGTVTAITVGGDVTWGDDVIDIGTFLTDAERGLYNLYVLDPSSRQVLRYSAAGDGSGFPRAPAGYLAVPRDLSDVRQMLVDGDIYFLEASTLERYESGRKTDYALSLPDDTDLRPGTDFRLLTATAGRRLGSVYIWDARHGRILRFSKVNGDYDRQYIPGQEAHPFEDLRGMFLVERKDAAPLLYWANGGTLFVSAIEEVETGGASPSPGQSPASSGSPSAAPASP